MKKLFFLTMVLLLADIGIIHAQATGFEIIYNADNKYAQDSAWLHNIRTNWYATGINLRIQWRDVLKTAPSTNIADSDCNWAGLDTSLARIARSASNPYLDIYIRVNMCETDTSWTNYLINNDTLICKAYDGSDFENAYSYKDDGTPYFGKKMISVLSQWGQAIMKKFYGLVLAHLNASSYKSRIKLIVPTFSQDDESDLPSMVYRKLTTSDQPLVSNDVVIKLHPWSTGFSTCDMKAFENYLMAKYSSIGALNAKWGSNLANFDKITDINTGMRKWGWYSDEGIYNPLNNSNHYLVITYPHGKKDWVDFKTETLRKFHNELAGMTSGFKYGVQPAPLYINVAEDRGYYDPTSIFENADFIVTADGPANCPNFDWSGDVMRSISKFWVFERGTGKVQRQGPVKFATELSWLYYDVVNGVNPVYYPYNTSDATTIASKLDIYYPRQITSFYNKGASAIFLSHFGNDPDFGVAQVIIDNRTTIEPTKYKHFIDTLKYYKNRAIASIAPIDHAYHLSFEQGLYIRGTNDLDSYNHNEGVIISGSGNNDVNQIEYPLLRFCRKLSNYTLDYAYNGSGDFITNFMIRYDSTYFRLNYGGIFLTGTSNFIPDDVYEIFMQPSYCRKFLYTTRYRAYQDSLIQTEYFTPGLYNEYNVKRTPIRFLWQTRTDLQGIFPNCSLPNPTQTQYGWYLNDLTKDIVFWANNNAIQQYRGFSIYNSSSNPHYYYDVNIAGCWKSSSTDSLRQKYPDGHYCADSRHVDDLTMLEFAIDHDPLKTLVPNYSMFTGYSNWPRLTTTGSMSKKTSTKSIPITFDLSQNYPNPFNPTTEINYSVPSKSYITLKIYDILGREISTLVNEVKQPGNYSVVFNASRLSSGVYIYTLSNQSSRISKKLLFIK